MKRIILNTLFLCSSIFLFAQQSITVSPLTNQYILVHIDEGSIERPGNGESTSADVLNGAPIDINVATNTSNYSISSTDDLNYANAQTPINLNRKSKGTEFANLCEGWSFLDFFGTWGCDNTSVDHFKEHWIYLEMPFDMQSGKSYSINIGNLATGQSNFDFTFDETSHLTEVIHVNNLGYSVDANLKYGYVYSWAGDMGSMDFSAYNGNEFGLIDTQTGEIAYTGSLAFRKNKFTIETYQENSTETPNQNFNQADVFECDFSDFNEIGTYRLFVEGIGASHEFEISCNAIRPAFEYTMKGLFQNRSGIALEAPFVETARPAPHNPAITPGFSGQLKYTTTTICEVSNPDASEADKDLWEAGIQGDLTDTWGWYQDAGDWDAYMRHMNVPSKLLFTFEHFPQNFDDAHLNIPESGNGIADILDEARWLVRFYKRIKDETEFKGWTTGGVPGSRIFGDLWGEDLPNDIGRGSWQDNDRIWVASGEDPWMTYFYAATVAHLAFLYDRESIIDSEFINWTGEAINAYEWAAQNENVLSDCHNDNINSLKAYAAAALFRITGEAQYEADLATAYTQLGHIPGSELQGLDAYGAYIYDNAAANNSALQNGLRQSIEYTADFYLLDNIDNRASRWGGNHYFPMIVGHATTPYVFEGIMGYAMLKNSNPSKAAQYWQNLHTTADYFLGTNPLNMTWITGLGEKNPKQVFHLDSWFSSNKQIKDGIVP